MKTFILKKLAQLLKYTEYYIGVLPYPLRVSIEITDRCNFLCPTCSKWKTSVDPDRELDTDEWKHTLDKLQGKIVSKRITISGGEPLLRSDLFDTIEYAKHKGFHVSLLTNGFLLTKDILVRLEKVRLDTLVISLNGTNERTHDNTRGVRESYTRIMNVLPTLHKYNIKTDLQTILMDTNVDEILPLAELAKKHRLHGISFQVLADARVHYPFVDDHMDTVPQNWYKTDRFWIKDTVKISRVIQLLLKKKQRGFPILNSKKQLKAMIRYYSNPESVKRMLCLSGSNVYIDPYGMVHLCYGFEPIGNIRRDDLRRIWTSRRARIIRGKIKRCQEMCRLLNNNF
ncbi:MAG: radical SAM protein [Gemmatimonadota bacterium]|nr:MAG: radical SAM protein [Gemmatimonadota bacterium]